MNDLIKGLNEKLSTLHQAGSISQPVFAMLTGLVTDIHKRYIGLHGRDAKQLEKYRTREAQLPLLGKAASILLTLRTALPVDGDCDNSAAEDALTSTISEIASQLKEAMTVES